MEEYLYSKKELIEIIKGLEEEKKKLEEALSTEREKHDILVNTLTKHSQECRMTLVVMPDELPEETKNIHGLPNY